MVSFARFGSLEYQKLYFKHQIKQKYFDLRTSLTIQAAL